MQAYEIETPVKSKIMLNNVTYTEKNKLLLTLFR